MAHVQQLEVGKILNFSTLLWDRAGRGVVVDPAFEVPRILQEAARLGVELEAVLLTHTHPDHTNGAEEVVRETGARLHVGRLEVEAARRAAPSAEVVSLDGDEALVVGQLEIRTLATPGHTIAGISYLVDGLLLTGDTLFVGGCGRSDLPGGDPRTLWASLQRLAALPGETRVLPGHDYGWTTSSTIAHERATNPYLLCADEAEFIARRTGPSPPRPTRGPR